MNLADNSKRYYNPYQKHISQNILFLIFLGQRPTFLLLPLLNPKDVTIKINYNIIPAGDVSMENVNVI
jgi:hypothetical protein